MWTLRKRLLCGLSVLLFAIMLVSCAHFVQNSAASLSASKNFYELAKGVARDLDAQGKIDPATKEKINSAAEIYKAAHNVAVDALVTYNATDRADDKAKLTTAMTKAIDAWADVARLINAIRPGAVPAELGGGI